MTRAGEKLYGDWRRAIEADRRRPSSLTLRAGLSVLALLTIASAALLEFGR